MSPPPSEYPLPAAEYPPSAYPPPPAYSPQEQPLYPAGGNPGPGANPLSAPTAAVHMVPPQGGAPSVYRSRNPVTMIVIAVVAALLEIPALRLLGSATIADNVSANGVVAGTFLVVGIPVFAYGVYGMLGGGPVGTSPAAWLKQPLIYVPLGVLLFLFAALAA